MEYRGRPLIHPETIAAWRDWLTKHHLDTDGVWLARWKKASGKIPLEVTATRVDLVGDVGQAP